MTFKILIVVITLGFLLYLINDDHKRLISRDMDGRIVDECYEQPQYDETCIIRTPELDFKLLHHAGHDYVHFYGCRNPNHKE